MSKTRKYLSAVFFLLLVGATVWIVGFRGTLTLRETEGAIFGTSYHIKYECAADLGEDILQEL